MPKLPTIEARGQLATLRLPRPTAEDFGAEGFREFGKLGATLTEVGREIEHAEQLGEGRRIRKEASVMLDDAMGALETNRDHRTYLQRYTEHEKRIRSVVQEQTKGLRREFAKAVEDDVEVALAGSRRKAGADAWQLSIQFQRGEGLKDVNDLAKQAARARDPEERKRLEVLGYKSIELMALKGVLNNVEATEWRERFESSIKKNRQEFFDGPLQDKLTEIANKATLDPVNAAGYQREAFRMIEDAVGDWLPKEKSDEIQRDVRNSIWLGAVETLIDEDPQGTLKGLKAGKYSSVLSQQGLLSLRTKAENEIERREKKAEAEKRERHARSKEALKDYATVVGMGLKPAMNVGDLRRRIGEFPDLTEEFNQVERASIVRGQAKALDPVSLQNLIVGLRSKAQTAEGAELIKHLEGDLTNMRSGLNEDSLAYGTRALGLTLAPVDPTDSTSLQLRAQQASVVRQRFGFPTSVFTRDEVGAVTRRLDELPPAQRAQAYGAIGRALPEEVGDATFSQFAKSGQKDSAVIADVARVDAEAAEMILLGRQLRKDTKALQGIFTNAAQKDLFSKIDEKAQAAYKHSLDEHWPHVRQAIADAYLAQHARGGFGAEKVDRGTVDEAVRRVTGGLLNIRGQSIVAPRPGVTEEQFMRMLTDDSLWTDLAPGFSKGHALSRTDAKFESAGSGRYLIRFGAGYVKAKDGRRFLLDLRGVAVPPALVEGGGPFPGQSFVGPG